MFSVMWKLLKDKPLVYTTVASASFLAFTNREVECEKGTVGCF